MSTRPDDWDQDERQALDGLEDQLDTIRRRHAGNPPIELLRAARASALPDDAQADVQKHLAENAWSRALVEGLEDGGDAPALDRVGEERLWKRIQKDTAGGAHGGRRWAPLAWGGAALAASVLLAVVLNRQPAPPVDTTASTPPAPVPQTEPDRRPTAAPMLLAFSKPDIKLSAAALTWRGAPTENPFLLNLKPAVDAYRDGDYAQADSRFTELAVQYPRSVEVAFFLGVTRMLREDFAGATAPLADALALGDPAFADDAAWYLAVAEQRSGREEEARRRLAGLCKGQGARAREACEADRQLSGGPATPP